MNRDTAIERYLDGNGRFEKCPKCIDNMIVDKTYAICLNEECDYQLRVLEGGNK